MASEAVRRFAWIRPLVVRHDVGVRVRDPHRPSILIKAIDEDFFDHG